MNDLDFKHKKEVFKVPENYFEELEQNILAQTVDAKKEKVKVIPLKNKRFYLFSSVVGVAASLLLLIGVFFNSSKQTAITENDIITAENSIYSTLLGDTTVISDEELLSYDTNYVFE